MFVHATNERPATVDAELEVVLYKGGDTVVGRGARPMSLGPDANVELPVLELFDGFQDLSYAYRFGPPSCDLVIATLRGPGGARLAEAFHFPVGLAFARERDLGLSVEITPTPGGDARLTVRTPRFAQAIAIDVDGFVPDDDHFHVAPGGERTVHLLRATAPTGPRPAARGTLQALNATTSTTIVVPAFAPAVPPSDQP